MESCRCSQWLTSGRFLGLGNAQSFNVVIVMWLHLFVTKEFRIQTFKQQRVTLVKSDSLESRCRADA